MIGCYRLNNGKWERFDVISKANSVIWTRRFYEVGSFQMTIKNNVFQKYDLVAHEGKCGIVMRIQETWQGCNVYGYDLKGVAHFRKMSEQTITAGTNVESTLRTWISTYLLTGNRAIEGLSLGASQGMTQTFTEELVISEGAKLSDVLEEQCKKYGIGWDITFNKGVLTFSFIKPKDNPDIVFSRKRRTLEEAERIIDAYDEVNNSGKGIFRREGDTITEASDYITGTAIQKRYEGRNFLSSRTTLGEQVKSITENSSSGYGYICPEGQSVIFGHTSELGLKPNKEYTLSFYAWSANNYSVCWDLWVPPNIGDEEFLPQRWFDVTPTPTLYQWTFETHVDFTPKASLRFLNVIQNGEINNVASPIYVTDFKLKPASVAACRLGDKVKVEEFGMLANQQITEMQYVYEPNNIIVVPSFGEVKKNIIKKLMKG